MTSEHNPGEPDFGHDEAAEHNPGEPQFGTENEDEGGDAETAEDVAERAEGHS